MMARLESPDAQCFRLRRARSPITLRRAVLAIVVVVVGVLPATASAASRYAAPTPQGAADCSTAADACDFTTAITAAHSGDNVYVIANQGNYSLSANINSPTGVPIHIHGFDGRPHLVFTNGGLRLKDGTADTLSVENTVDGSTAFALDTSSASGDGIIAKASGGGHACYMDGATLTNSVCWAGSTGDLSLEADGSNVVRNDDFIGGTAAAIAFFARSCTSSCPSTFTDTVVDVIARSEATGTDIGACSDGTAIAVVNVSYSNFATSGTHTGCDATKWSVNVNGTDQASSPSFVNGASGDFRETAGSPTVDAGSPKASCAAGSADGSSRPDGVEARCDIGAYEFHDPADRSAPTIAITTPFNGAHYKQGHKVNAKYSCTDPDGPSDVALCAGPAQSGKPIDTSTPGAHSFTVQASDKAGNATKKTVHYTVDTTVSSPPVVKGFPQNQGCAPKGLTLHVSVHPTGLKQVLVSLDGTEIATSKKSTFKVKITASQLSPGRHKVTIERDYKSGTTRRSNFSFATCKGGGKSPHIRTQGTPDQGSCTAKPFKIVVTISGAKTSTIVVKLDGKKLKPPAGKSKFTLSIDTAKLKPGAHRVTITAADKHKNSSVSVTTFVRCA